MNDGIDRTIHGKTEVDQGVPYRLRTYNALSESCLDIFHGDQFTIGCDELSPHAIILRSHALLEDEVPDGVLAIGRAGAGVNNIPVDIMTERGIPVFNTPGANANSVAELTIFAIGFLYRHLGQAWDLMGDLLDEVMLVKTLDQDDSAEDYLATQIESGKKQFKGCELRGRTIGLVGLGAIGVKVANLAHAFGMRVIWYDPDIRTQSALELMVPDNTQKQNIDDVLKDADVVSFHVPLNEQTKWILNTRRMALMRDDAMVVNFAKKGIVDEHVLVQALDNGRLGGYITDFGCKKHPRILNLPHLGASTNEAEDLCGVMIGEQIRDYLENGNIINSVNFPTVSLPRNGNVRISIVNRNIPNMLSGVTDVLGDASMNIEDILNRSQGDIAYTILDIAEHPPEFIMRKLQELVGVLSVRVLE